MTGYELRLHRCEQRGETSEGLMGLPPEADTMPCWMGIATIPSGPAGLEKPEEDSASDGSF